MNLENLTSLHKELQGIYDSLSPEKTAQILKKKSLQAITAYILIERGTEQLVNIFKEETK